VADRIWVYTDPRGGKWYWDQEMLEAMDAIDRAFPDAVPVYARCCRSSRWREIWPLTNPVTDDKGRKR